jgi:hypothetical protein
MEQRLDATYLRSGPFERAAAIGISAVAIGTGILLAAWGISFLWRYTPPEIAVRIANPEVRVTQSGPLTVTQDKPFILAQPEPFKIEPGQVTVKVEQQPPATSAVGGNTKTATGEIIEREVTVFSNVRHGPGVVVTGWSYRDGSGGVPIQQYCYYTTPNIDHSSKRVDIASNRVRSSNIDAGVVPDPEGALAKCQWWQA